MLNLGRESEGCVHSFKLSRENIKHDYLPCDSVQYLNFIAKW
jgi:hypothetical protein